ncbi:MAG TPA: hypothetical protein V6D07_03625 [Trichocoleus sp.]
MFAYLTYGRFIQVAEVEYIPYIWIMSGMFVIVLAAILTVLWRSSQTVLLLGFQSDAGHLIMVLFLSSVAFIAVIQFRIFSYILVMVAASLLARVDTLIAALSNQLAFMVLVFFPLLGLALSWVPLLFVQSG